MLDPPPAPANLATISVCCRVITGIFLPFPSRCIGSTELGSGFAPHVVPGSVSALLRAWFFLSRLCSRLSENLHRQVIGFVHSELDLLAVKPSEALRCPLSVLYRDSLTLRLDKNKKQKKGVL